MKGSLREQRPGYWQLRVYAGLHPHTRRAQYVTRGFRGGRREAENELAKLVTEVGRGRHRAARVTVGDFLAEWFAGQTSWAPGTERRYRTALMGHILPALGKVDLGKLTVRQVDDFYRAMSRQGQSASSVRQAHALLHRAIDDAVRWGHRSDNPTEYARLPRARKADVVPPSAGALLRLVDAAEADRDHLPGFAALVRLAAATGARRGELCALRWSDLESPVLRISRSLYGRREKDTKTHRSRTLTLDADTLSTLELHRRAMEKRAAVLAMTVSADAYMFSSEPNCSLPWHPDSVSHYFGQLREAAGVGRVRLHDLRHWSNSVLLDAGLDPKTVQRRHGHASGSMMMDVYGHAMRPHDDGAAEVIRLALRSGREDAGRPEGRPAEGAE